MYRIKNNDVIFKIPLSDVLHDNLKSIQELEEWLFDNFESYSLYIDKSYIQYINKDEAINYLINQGYTNEEIKENDECLEDNILTAMVYAKDDSYQCEWIKEYEKILEEAIEGSLDDNQKLITSIENIGFDDEYFEIKVKKSVILDDYNDKMYNDYTEDEKIELYYEDFSFRGVNMENIDRYGTLGNFDEWLDYFKEDEDVSVLIDKQRKDDNERKTCKKRLKKDIADITNKALKILEYHEKNQELKNNIYRNLKSIQKIVK
jgi:hypothetical protein